jgi:hypothetical protein
MIINLLLIVIEIWNYEQTYDTNYAVRIGVIKRIFIYLSEIEFKKSLILLLFYCRWRTNEATVKIATMNKILVLVMVTRTSDSLLFLPTMNCIQDVFHIFVLLFSVFQKSLSKSFLYIFTIWFNFINNLFFKLWVNTPSSDFYKRTWILLFKTITFDRNTKNLAFFVFSEKY